MSAIGGLLAEAGPFVIGGLLLIVLGLGLIGLWKFTDPNDGYERVHERPKQPKPWNVEPEEPPYRPRHNFAGDPGDATRRLFPVTNTARARVGYAGEPSELDHAGTPGRVREAQEEDGQEEGGADRERREDEGRALPHGEEGSEDAQAARTLIGWFYSPPMDAYYLLDDMGTIVYAVEAIDWEEKRGATAKDLLVQGLPMIPEHVPYHGREVS